MVKIALTGPDGLIGSRIVELLKDRFEFIPLKQSTLDITKKDLVNKIVSETPFDIFLHLAAYTNVDQAEKDKESAYSINVEGTKNVFEAALNKGKKFIYISTDFVFDGHNPPYFEDSQPNPLSYYGQTKYEAEKLVKDKAMIVRFSYPYRASFDLKKDFVKTIKASLEQKKSLSMVTDSLITPTLIDDIVMAFDYLFQNHSNKTYHLVGSDSFSPFDAGKLIAKTFKLDESLIRPTTFEEYSQGKAKRPKLSQMKSKNNDFYKMKGFEEGLYEIKSQIANLKP